jgi:hypothetical protein
MGFEPTIPAFKRAKTIHALDSAATVTDRKFEILVKGEFSTPRRMAPGVPQGSVLTPVQHKEQ